jgi:hypothetical protein
MMNLDGTPTEAPNHQVLTAAVENDSEKKRDSAPDGALTEKLEAQSMSYRRSRDVGLMKLALLRPEDDEAV